MSAKTVPVDDLVIFKAETQESPEKRFAEPWKVLVIDDDEQVHKVTSLVLSDIKILERPLNFLHAYSAVEAKNVLEEETEIAVILLDVVMENNDSGLELARIIRTELKLDVPRIIIRTGQPGYAPELEIIQTYDINDYRMKSELTRTRLITALTTAIRSYQQVYKVKKGEEGMRQIIEATNSIFKAQDHQQYSVEVIRHCAAILGIDNPGGMLLNKMQPPGNKVARTTTQVSAATGHYGRNQNLMADELTDGETRKLIRSCLEERRSIFDDSQLLLYINSEENKQSCLLLDLQAPMDEVAKSLMEVFSVSIGIGFKNIRLITQLNQYAYFDHLSSLPNRTRFILDISRIGMNLADSVVAVLDVDSFASINNALGHKSGDLLIQAISDRLVNSLPSKLVIARIGGDTFGIMGPDDLMHPDLLLKPFKRPFVIKNTPFPISATVGLARLNGKQLEGLEILKNADMAMKLAKKSQGSSWLYYSSEMADLAESRLEITRNLHPALAKDEFVIFFQPQVSIGEQKLTGVECLVRWIKEDGTLVPPDQFIPIAESTGLILDIGKQIFHKACRHAKNWMEKGMLDFKIAVNVSVKQFLDPDFIDGLQQMLSDEDISAEHFELEITESTLMNEVESVITLMEELKEIGFAISVDDFGTGYSSLSYLLRLPIQRLKVDRSFIMNLETDEKSRTITELILSMGKNLGLLTIAEGIETKGQLNFISELGCNDAQGFFYSKPLKVEDFEKWYSDFKSKKI